MTRDCSRFLPVNATGDNNLLTCKFALTSDNLLARKSLGQPRHKITLRFEFALQRYDMECQQSTMFHTNAVAD